MQEQLTVIKGDFAKMSSIILTILDSQVLSYRDECVLLSFSCFVSLFGMGGFALLAFDLASGTDLFNG